MHFWRISNYADLQGVGGLKASGRWHNRGASIVYLAEHPALALLEIMVHMSLGPEELPSKYQLLKIEYAERKGIAKLKDSLLDKTWADDQELTRSIGDEWLQTAKSLFLRVPSAVVPHSYNYLFNPKHPLAVKAQIIRTCEYPVDTRLL